MRSLKLSPPSDGAYREHSLEPDAKPTAVVTSPIRFPSGIRSWLPVTVPPFRPRLPSARDGDRPSRGLGQCLASVPSRFGPNGVPNSMVSIFTPTSRWPPAIANGSKRSVVTCAVAPSPPSDFGGCLAKSGCHTNSSDLGPTAPPMSSLNRWSSSKSSARLSPPLRRTSAGITASSPQRKTATTRRASTDHASLRASSPTAPIGRAHAPCPAHQCADLWPLWPPNGANRHHHSTRREQTVPRVCRPAIHSPTHRTRPTSSPHPRGLRLVKRSTSRDLEDRVPATIRLVFCSTRFCGVTGSTPQQLISEDNVMAKRHHGTLARCLKPG